MKQENIKITSLFDGLNLDAVMTVPQKVEKVLLINHGMCEYKERYLDFMKYLSENNIACCIFDMRGHGKSLKDEKDLGYMYDDSGRALVEDIRSVIEYLKERFPNTELTLMGHSMGSLVVRAFTRKYDSLIDKLIVMGSPSANPAVTAGIALIDMEIFRKGDRHLSRMVTAMSVGPYDNVYPEEGHNSWLSANKENVIAYNDDPMCGFIFTLNGYRNLMMVLRRAYARRGWVMQNYKLPVFFVSGEDDPCAVNKDKFYNAVESMKSHGYTDVISKMYPGMRHEILNEDNKEEVYKDIINFIK